jgi:tetratricopeptide (TPR) repeat protein
MVRPTEFTPGPRREGARPWLIRGVAWSSLPALAAAGLAAATALAASRTDPRSVAAEYARMGSLALEARDYPRARVCYERLAQDAGAGAETCYGLARALEGLGHRGRAARLRARAAPADQPGFAPAHLDEARGLLSRQPTRPEDVVAAERHLRLALAASPPAGAEANALLGQIYAATGRPHQAVPHLVAAAPGLPEMRITLARAYRALDRDDDARREAGLAYREFHLRLTADPDDLAARLRCAEAGALLDDHASAAAVLEEGLARTGDPRLRSSLASILAAWSDAAARRGRPGDRLALLGRGLRVDPTSRPLLERLGQVLRDGGPEAASAREALRDLLARGQATSAAHFTLGVDAWMRGDAAAARAHLEEADRLEPGSPLVANNLAWVLARADPPDLGRALKLADLALERQPDARRFRGTRGDVLARLGRWRDALPELEAGLADAPDDPDLHRALADTYDHLGDADMAARHRTIAGAARPSGSGGVGNRPAQAHRRE